MTALQLQFWSLMAAVALGILNLTLIPLIKNAQKGQVSELREQFEKMIATHNESLYSHPSMTLVARNEVSRVAETAQSAAAAVAKTAQEAAADVAKTAREAVSKVALDAEEAVVRVRDGIEGHLEKMRKEIHTLGEEFAAFRLEVAGWKPRERARSAQGWES